jgi:chorismate-pyruvate lyase
MIMQVMYTPMANHCASEQKYGESDTLRRRLSDRLLASPSATAVLQSWCEAQGIGQGKIAVVHLPLARQPAVHDYVLDALMPTRRETITVRRVHLVRGRFCLCEADNWFVPERLTKIMVQTLAATNIPFGRVIERVKPFRRTIHIRFLPGSVDCGELAPENAMPIFEHTAVVNRADGTPVSVVHEVYRSTLLQPPMAQSA